MPRDALAVAIVPTDLESEQVRRSDLDAAIERRRAGEGTGELESSREGLEGRLRVEIPGGLG